MRLNAEAKLKWANAAEYLQGVFSNLLESEHMSQAPSRARILLVEDEVDLATEIHTALTHEKYLVKTLHDGQQAMDFITQFRPDLVLLDIMLPSLDGLKIAEGTIKKFGIPVIFMTARDSALDRISGLQIGADDYISKPFLLAELLLRIKAVLRRVGLAEAPLEISSLVINPNEQSVTVSGSELELTATEYRLLVELVRSKGKVLSKTFLLAQVWSYDAFDPNLVEVHLSSLRRKLAKLGLTDLIQTRRGLGYLVKA
jgi:DNA-binding response OmpR family regulator